MSIAVIITDRNTDQLCDFLRLGLPDVTVQQWPDINHPETVEMAVLWNHPKGITKSFPHLKMVVSMGAGMDHIQSDEAIQPGIMVDRIVTPVLQQNMAQYVLQHILRNHRHQSAYAEQQRRQVWQVLETDQMPTVGFLGLGVLGSFVADQCKCLGFETIAWTSTTQHQNHVCFHGEAGLQTVCERSDFLVVLLPLNEATQKIINQKTLSFCKPDCTLINVGRGGHVHEQDLIKALDEGVIKQAVLDVFNQEPLPVGHPFWINPKVVITPHGSSRSDVRQTAEQIVRLYHSLV
jgi:glyoxylate/hydroxypyruvate reductase A